MSTDTLRIWSRLGTTDPNHTKAFQRAGGFRGTAVRPIYCEQRMTELFGPCGEGWGYSEPRFQLVSGHDGETAVYCWLTLWYVENGKRSEPIPGIGGDIAARRSKDGRLILDDEAFKKAATDALGNAMKHLGMSADIHMGRFDDAKYVAAVRAEMAEEKGDPTRAPATKAPPEAPQEPRKRQFTKDGLLAVQHVDLPGGGSAPDWKSWCAQFRDWLESEGELPAFNARVEAHKATIENLSHAKPGYHKHLMTIIENRRGFLAQDCGPAEAA